MKSFYSILKLSPNIATEDSVAIGMLLFDGEQFRCFFSDKKKRLVNSLLDEKNVNLNFIISQIMEKCNEINNDKNELQFFYKYEKLTDLNYFNYLSNYSNGLIQFSKPNMLYEKLDDTGFDKLINFLFKETLYKIEPPVDNFLVIKDIINRKLLTKVSNRVHTNYKFNQEKFPSLYFSFEMDCIGLNGSLTGAKSLSFDKSLQVIDKDISHYFTLISSLTSKYKKSLEDNNFFLISEEPESNSSKEHKLWESVSYNKLITVINPEESDRVAELIIKNNSAKFLIEAE
ncbi:MAG: hypothetical protein Q8S41_03080 [Lutibacter sp.]|nr:hypothetical protein [Lutibacter sp.]